MTKQDNPADNVEHLRQSIYNRAFSFMQKLHEAEDYLNEFSSEISSKVREQIEAQNER
ncbi:small acid-soluble spore protein Tlp [Paenibacillus sp. CN-4]|uniref:small acid-soluble spore protein Tlp n=1 Tax=Paenibacillus nanchangensis TaxID=3348343 RepID=UPI0039783B86